MCFDLYIQLGKQFIALIPWGERGREWHVIIVEHYRTVRQLCRIFPEGSTKRVMISSHPGNYLLVRLLLTNVRYRCNAPRENKMKKTVFVALLLVIGMALAFPQPGYSQCYGYDGYCGPGVLGAAGAIVGTAGAIVVGAGAAVVGAAGAIVGTVVGPGYGYYGPPAYYGYPRPAYGYPAPAYGYRYPYYGPRPLSRLRVPWLLCGRG